MNQEIPKNLIDGALKDGELNDTPANLDEHRKLGRAPLFDPDPHRAEPPTSFSDHPLSPKGPFGETPESPKMSEEETKKFIDEQHKRTEAFRKGRLN